MNNNFLSQIEEKLDLYFGKKAPAMPENIKEGIVKFGPYLVIISMIMVVPGLLLAFGLTRAVMPYAYYSGLNPGFSFSFPALISFVALIIEAIAIPGLLKRTKKSWQFMFYASLVSLLGSLLSLSLGGFIIGGVISFYILFQIRSLYKN